VQRPRLRHREQGEVKVPAYEALQDNDGTAERMMGALLGGVSTRQYEEVLPEMAATVGVSHSSVRRQAIVARNSCGSYRSAAGTRSTFW